MFIHSSSSTTTHQSPPAQNGPFRMTNSSLGQSQLPAGVSPVIMNSSAVENFKLQSSPSSNVAGAGLAVKEYTSDRDNQIRMQASRVQQLEDRVQNLLEESSKQDQIVNMKQNECVQWQENYNALRDDFLQKSTQMSKMEEEIDDMLKKQAQIINEIEQNENIIRNYHNDIYAKNEDVQYWKDRSAQQAQAQQQLTHLEQQIEIITQENQKLNKLLMQNTEFQK